MGKSIKKTLFIFFVVLFALSSNGCGNTLTKASIDSTFDQTIEEKLNNITNPMNSVVSLSSNPYDYIKNPDAAQNYKYIVSQGEKSLNFMLNKFAGSNENGLKEYIMAIACSEILKEDTSSKKWVSGREWYDNYIRQNTNNGQESFMAQPNEYTKKLYQYRETYPGDNSKVAAIVHMLTYTDVPFKSIELKTDSEPYRVTVNYQVDSRANFRFRDDITTGWNKNAVVMFSLIPNADEFVFSLDDEYGNFTWSFYNRENLSERFGMEYFTADTVKEAAGSLDSYTNYLNMVSAIKNTEDSYGESQKQNIERSKQIYVVIGNDCEITVNSGVNFPIMITEEIAANPPIKELSDQKNILAQYTGQQIEFLIYQINNFKTNYRTFYLFAFDGEKLIAYADLKTADAEQNAITAFLALQGIRR